jgi:hypothetical protein
MSSCSEISNQLSALSADIAALDNKFVTKAEFNEFKNYVDKGFTAITETLYKLYQKLENEKAGMRDIGFVDNRVDELQRQIDRWQGEDRNLAGYATKQELYQLGISLRSDLATVARLSNTAYQIAVSARNEILPFKRRIEIVELDVRNIKSVADIAVRQSSDALNETRSLKAKVTILEGKVTALDTLIKLLQGSIGLLTKTVAGLGVAVVAMQAQIAYLYSQLGKNNRYDELLARIDEAFRIAVNARLKANNAYDLAKQVDGKISGIERTITQLDERITRVTTQLQQDIRTLGDTLRREIQYLKDRAFAAMQRLEAKIDYQTQFILDSVRVAINSVYSRISALETALQKSINSLDSRLSSKITTIEKTIVNLYALTFDALDRIDDLDRLQIPQLRMAITALQARINALPKTTNRIETKTLQLQPQYFFNTIVTPTTIKEIVIRELQPINNTFYSTNTIEKIIQVAVPQQIINNKYESINQNITTTTIEMVRFTKITVPTGTCELVDGLWQFVESVVDVDVIIGENGSDALNTVNSFIEKFKSNKMLCEAKNKEDCECYASVPLNFQIKPEWSRPQEVLHFATKKSDGSFDSAKYVINVPHWTSQEGSVISLPSYEKGNFETILSLGDNSKITVNAKDLENCNLILDAIIPYINPDLLVNSQRRPCGIVSDRITIQRVYPRYGNYFKNGAKNGKPDRRDNFLSTD